MNWSRKLNRLDAELKEFHRFNELAADVIWTLEDRSRLTGQVPMRNDGFVPLSRHSPCENAQPCVKDRFGEAALRQSAKQRTAGEG